MGWLINGCLMRKNGDQLTRLTSNGQQQVSTVHCYWCPCQPIMVCSVDEESHAQQEMVRTKMFGSLVGTSHHQEAVKISRAVDSSAFIDRLCDSQNGGSDTVG